jgi:hypothetical protein
LPAVVARLLRDGTATAPAPALRPLLEEELAITSTRNVININTRPFDVAQTVNSLIRRR